MKRKIYHTPHGRVMFKIIKATTNDPQTEISIRFKPELLKYGARFSVVLTAAKRRFQEQGFKLIDAQSAADFAQNVYHNLIPKSHKIIQEQPE